MLRRGDRYRAEHLVAGGGERDGLLAKRAVLGA